MKKFVGLMMLGASVSCGASDKHTKLLALSDLQQFVPMDMELLNLNPDEQLDVELVVDTFTFNESEFDERNKRILMTKRNGDGGTISFAKLRGAASSNTVKRKQYMDSLSQPGSQKGANPMLHFLKLIHDMINKMPDNNLDEVQLIWRAIHHFYLFWPQSENWASLTNDNSNTDFDKKKTWEAVNKYLKRWESELTSNRNDMNEGHLETEYDPNLASALPFAEAAMGYLRFWLTLNPEAIPASGKARNAIPATDQIRTSFGRFQQLLTEFEENPAEKAKSLDNAVLLFHSVIANDDLNISMAVDAYVAVLTSGALSLLTAALLVWNAV